MKIIIATDVHGLLGGIRSVNNLIASSFRESNYTVEYMSLLNPSGLHDGTEIDRLKKYTIHNKLAKDNKGILGIKYFIKILLTPIWKIDRNFGMIKYVGGLPKNSVIIFSMTNIAYLALKNPFFRLILKVKNIKTAYQFHSSFESFFTVDEVFKVGDMVDLFITLSKGDSEKFSKRVKAPTIYLENPSPGYSPQEKFLNRPKQISVISRLSSEKNITTIISAFNRISPHHPEWTLKIFGSGGEKEKILAAIQETQNKKISYEGEISPAEVPKTLESSRLLAMASDIEGMPMSLLEAAAMGTPSISNKSSDSVFTFIKKTNGYLSPSLDIKEYADTLSSALEQLSTDVTPSESCLLYSQKNSINNFKKKWVRIIGDLTE